MVWNRVLPKPWITVTEKWMHFTKIFGDLEATRKLLLQTGEHKHFRISTVLRKVDLDVITILL